MSDEPVIKSIRVHILGREYALRVREEDESHTRQMAAFVNARMEQFKDAHPEQSELTTAVITALTLSEELHLLRESGEADAARLTDALGHLADRLAQTVDPAPGTPPAP
jgi:cell division protein ZapA